jgi:DNA-binding MarR family transcriptional regulator
MHIESQPSDESASHLLHRATQLVTSLYDRVLGHHELTHSQVLVMLAIAQSPGTSQKLVSTATSIDRSTLTDVTSRLVRKGYVRRQRSRSDARRYNLTLTREGEQALAEARPLVQEVDRRLLAHLPDHEAAELMRLLCKTVSEVGANTRAEITAESGSERDRAMQA